VTEFEVEHKDWLRWLKFYQGKEMTTRVSNLLPGQEYQVRVRARGRDKVFPFSDILVVITKVGGKCNKYNCTSKLVYDRTKQFLSG
jgi:translation elongation factor EF-4